MSPDEINALITAARAVVEAYDNELRSGPYAAWDMGKAIVELEMALDAHRPSAFMYDGLHGQGCDD